MSFQDIETSHDRGKPVDLYLFQYGPSVGNRIGLTDAEESIVFDGTTYQAETIKRAAVKASGTLDKSALEIRSDRENPVAELFRVYPPSRPVRLTIYQGHLDDPNGEFLVIWSGRVLNVKWENSECSLSCEPISTSLRRPGLRRRYQIACPHVLYGPICRANKAAATTAVTLAAAVPGTRVVRVNYTLGPNDNLLLRGGTLEWLTTEGISEARTILAVSQDGAAAVITLSGVVRDLPSGFAVNLVRGCGHNLTDCENVHNNLPNYGGMPWIPSKNPVGNYSPYY